MSRSRLIIWVLSIALGAGSWLLVGCSEPTKTDAPKQVAPRQEPQAVDKETQEAFTKKLRTFGIPIYKGAEFVEIKRKAVGSPMLYASYDVTYMDPKLYDDVKSFYAAKLKQVLGRQGWREEPAQENVILYRKGFDTLFVELSRVIVLPDTKKIRIAIHYGQ